MTERERALLQGKKINPLTANESALAYAVAHGTPEPTYETVAEIPVGAPVEDAEAIHEGCYYYVVEDTALAKAIMAAAGDNLFFNSAETPLKRLENEGAIFGYNFTMGEELPVVTGQPAYLVAATVEGETVVEIMSTEDLSNTTVKILKKVEQGGGGDSGDFLITATLDESKTPEEGTLGFFTLDKTAAEIEAAYTANRPMRVKIAHTENGMTNIFYFNLVGARYSDGTTTPDLIFIGAMAQNPPTVYTSPCYISFGEKEGESPVECVIYAPQTGS